MQFVAMPDESFDVSTPWGPGRFTVSPARRVRASLVLGHGAGGGIDAPDLARLARTLPAAGISVWRFEQPWRVAGRRIADRPERLDLAWSQALGDLQRIGALRGPLLVGGRSAGARVALRTSKTVGAVAVVALAFPLRPPGRTTSRAAELTEAAERLPVLVLQGTRDAFGSAEQVSAVLPARLRRRPVPPVGTGVCVVPLAGADHSLRVGKGPITHEEAWSQTDAVLSWWCRSVTQAGWCASAA